MSTKKNINVTLLGLWNVSIIGHGVGLLITYKPTRIPAKDIHHTASALGMPLIFYGGSVGF